MTNATPTVSPTVTPAEKLKAALRLIQAVADAVRELGEVPSGHLYAQLMFYMDLPTYQRVIDPLVEAGVVTEANHLLKWVGVQTPAVTSEQPSPSSDRPSM